MENAVSSDKHSDRHHKDPTKKHRHDIGDVDHGPATTEPTTRAIQGLLGIFIVASMALTIYAFAHAGFGIAMP